MKEELELKLMQNKQENDTITSKLQEKPDYNIESLKSQKAMKQIERSELHQIEKKK